MRLLNIYNDHKDIYCFYREDDFSLKIKKFVGFFPYFYEKSNEGNCKSYKGESLKRIFVSEPYDVMKKRSINAWEADIIFTKRFLIDKVDKIDKCPIKVGYVDFEMQASELPNVQEAKYPISCISIYNSLTKEIKTFFLPEFESEYKMMEAFVAYLQKEKFDILTGWNFTKFDFPYIANRFPDFVEKISPIHKTRYGDGQVFYPAGVSIIDYLEWYKKFTLNREKMYTLDYISQKYINEPPKAKIDFMVLNKDLKDHNINDVKCLAKLDEKFKLINYYDEIRRLSKLEWEDLLFNSRAIDMLLLEEAKNQKIVLPMKPDEKRGTLVEEINFEGAYRDIFATGRFENVYKADLTSAYPFSIINFCLSPENIVIDKIKNAIKINNTYFEQNENALLPLVTKKLIHLKNEIKKELNNTSVNADNFKEMKQKYDAIKGLVNSVFGVCGLRFFRLFNEEVASSITYLVRSLLHYVKDKLEGSGSKVLYIDTDGLAYQSDKDQIDYLNQLVKEWGKTFGKEKIDITFESDGIYEKVLFLALCRYYGIIKKNNGEIEIEKKGLELKRKDATNYIISFQETLIKKILDNESKEKIYEWIKTEINNFKNQNLIDISFPCKLKHAPENYKNVPIFVRALKNTPEFKHKIGDSFYYIFLNGQDESKKDMVKCLSEEQFNYIKKEDINWQKMSERNIIMKLDVIFNAMNWKIEDIYTAPVTTKICAKCGKEKSLSRFHETGLFCKVCSKHLLAETEKNIKQSKQIKIKINTKNTPKKRGRPRKVLNTPILPLNSSIIAPTSDDNTNKGKDTPDLTLNNPKTLQHIDNKEVKTDKINDIKEPINNEVQIPMKIIEGKKLDISPTELICKKIDFHEAIEFVKQYHYSKTMPNNTKISYGFYYENKLKAVITFGCPVGRSIVQWLQVPQGSCLELTRVASLDEMPKNTESYCISQALKNLNKDLPAIKYLISYADTNEGHCGYIYQASNWHYIGLQRQIMIAQRFFIDGKEIHSRNLNAKHGTMNFDKLKEIYGNRIERSYGVKKHIYLYCIGDKKERKEWYKKFPSEPYPKAIDGTITGKYKTELKKEE